MRRSWAAAVACGCLALSGLTLAPQTAASNATLAGSTTVRAGSSSSLSLDIPRDVAYSLSAEGPSMLAVSGNGRAVAAVLQRVGRTKASEAIVIARFNGCDAPGCAPAADAPAFAYVRDAEGSRRDSEGRPILAAGTYRLSVLTDGAPVEVRLRLDGLSGSTALEANKVAEAGVSLAAEALAVPAVPVAWSGSADLTFGSANTLLLGFLQQDTPTGTVIGAAGACHFSGAARPLLGVPAPGCPFEPNSGGGVAQVGSVSTEQLTLGSAERARMATMLPSVAGFQEAGLWSARTGATTTPLAFFAWLRLD